jgi:hypothetical protein
MTRLRIDGERTKQETAQATTTAAADGVKSYQAKVRDIIGRLLTPAGTLTPDAASAIGPVSSMLPTVFGKTKSAEADIAQLRSLLTLDKIAEMKRQSQTGATGLGAVNTREFGALEAAGSKLGATGIDEASYAAELKRILAAVGGGGTLNTGGTVAMVAPDGRRLSVPAEKVAEMEALGAKRQ